MLSLRRVFTPSMSRTFCTSIPSIQDQAVGREREELEDAKEGITTFNRDPITTTEVDGNEMTNPIRVPSFMDTRAVGISHNDSSYLMWFNLPKGSITYVEEVDKYFELYNPSEE